MEPRNEMLWSIAKKRASFKKQLVSYFFVNSFLWIVWFVSGRQINHYNHFPWPIWVMFWWGVGLSFSFANAYVFHSGTAIEEEYQKLKNQQ